MKHQHWVEMLAVSHPEEDLSPSEYAALKDHLAHCSECAAIHEHYLLMTSYFRAVSTAKRLPADASELVWTKGKIVSYEKETAERRKSPDRAAGTNPAALSITLMLILIAFVLFRRDFLTGFAATAKAITIYLVGISASAVVFSITVTACIVALTAVYHWLKRKKLKLSRIMVIAASGIVLLTIAANLVIGTIATSTPTTSTSSFTSNSPTPTAAQTSSLIEVPLSIEQPSGQNLSAVLYFGQLGVLLQNHTDVGFNTDSNFAQQHRQLCVETVVVNNISGNTASVFNQPVSGPSDSWGAAEAISQSTLAQTNYSVHQQLIIPAENIEVGTIYVTQAQVVIDQNIKAATETYRLTLKSITGPQAQWDIQKSDGIDAGTVACNTYPN